MNSRRTTKLEAFFDRGEHDYYGSHDLEDILTVLDGRAAVLEEIAQSPEVLQHYLAEQFLALVAEPDFIQCLPGHIPPDSASQVWARTLFDGLFVTIIRGL